MKKFIVIILFFCFTGILYSESSVGQKYLLENKSYRTKVDMKVCALKSETNCSILVGAESSFIVLDNSKSNYENYTIEFVDIYPDENRSNPKTVHTNKAYFINKSSNDGLPIVKNTIARSSGMVSGPLIIPFKYRLDDKSLVSDATLGIYVGWGFSTKFGGMSNEALTVIPFVSTGLSQITVRSQDKTKPNETTNRTGFTLATGLIIQNWDGVNIGIVYGEDRIGNDKIWEHEGEGWFSISVNWQL